MLFDAFISHAWEDKNDFVRQLAESLKAQRIEVWYDEFSLKVGDSLRRSIDLGLSRSRFGIVVLSKNFFDKNWPNWELDGLVQRQNSSDYNLIIPIWHNVDKEDVLKYSPSLADKVAIKSSEGIEHVVKQIDQIINPEGSTLIVARDLLLSYGYEPPVITDDWWLDVIEYCGTAFFYNEYLNFGVAWKGPNPKSRGIYTGLNALQMLWQQEAQANQINQLSHPSDVLIFIERQPGLKEACLANPKKTASFFPQLTITDFGGFLEQCFDELLAAGSDYRNKDCVEEIALRHLQFGQYSHIDLTNMYFTGGGQGLGPSLSHYDSIDCLVWLLSDKSQWLPKNIKDTLFKGGLQWSVWEWKGGSNSISDFEGNDDTGALSDAMFKALNKGSFKLTKRVERDVRTRLEHSRSILDLPETLDELVNRFWKSQAVEVWIEQAHKRWLRHR